MAIRSTRSSPTPRAAAAEHSAARLTEATELLAVLPVRAAVRAPISVPHALLAEPLTP
ncbi:hypothetical protein [Lentzea guizhouensis]|uniref:hypothetical protein n=1 Tax=Lentzea guizhouensis TaxID=1586287 RepID=UPI0012B69614|nr:hypothetical protein [Lentzea guizhouensis]